MLAVALMTAGAEAADVRVISAGAVRAIVTEMAQAYEKETGHTVVLAFGTVGVIRQRMAAEPADVVIMTDVAVDESTSRAPSWRAAARTSPAPAWAWAYAKARPSPTSPRRGIQAGAAGRQVHRLRGYRPGRDSGIHFASVLRALGIADAVKPKTTLVPGGYPAELVAKGEVKLVAHQIARSCRWKGVARWARCRRISEVTTYSAWWRPRPPPPSWPEGWSPSSPAPAFKAKFAAAGLDFQDGARRGRPASPRVRSSVDHEPPVRLKEPRADVAQGLALADQLVAESLALQYQQPG